MVRQEIKSNISKPIIQEKNNWKQTHLHIYTSRVLPLWLPFGKIVTTLETSEILVATLWFKDHKSLDDPLNVASVNNDLKTLG